MAKARESQRAGGFLAKKITNISDLIFLHDLPGRFNYRSAILRRHECTREAKEKGAS